MTKREYSNLQKLSNEQLIQIIKDYRHNEFMIGELLVDVSKHHIDAEDVVEEIRACLNNAPQYKFYDEHLGDYVDLQLEKITPEEYRNIILGIE